MGNLLCGTDVVKGAVFFVPVPGDVCGGREKTGEEGQLSGDNLVIFRRRTGGVSRKDFLLPEGKSVGGGRGSFDSRDARFGNLSHRDASEERVRRVKSSGATGCALRGTTGKLRRMLVG